METIKDSESIFKFARDIIGNETLLSLQGIERRKLVKKEYIRKIFTNSVKKSIVKMSPETLGLIISFGNHLGTNGMIVTTGRNPKYEIFIGINDSGIVLLQKITVATILLFIDKIINEGRTNSNGPLELAELNQVCKEHLENKSPFSKILSW